MSILPSSPTKLNYQEFIKTCTPLYKIPSLEKEYAQKVDSIANALRDFQPSIDPEETLINFIILGRDFLGTILSLANLSQEKFMRILTAQRFAKGDYGTEWNVDTLLRKIRSDKIFAKEIAALFIEGKNNALLRAHVSDFYLENVELPNNWQSVIRDEKVVKNFIRKKLNGEYNNAKGRAIESLAELQLQPLVSAYGITHQHGQVALVRKEVDIAIPTLINPYIMIMSSYTETTASGLTQRTNEQHAMYEKIKAANESDGQHRIFVNILDGAGWLARRSDLKKLYEDCDYILNINTLAQLPSIVRKHLPEEFFTNLPRPVVQS